MLMVARLAPRQLAEATARIVEFLRGEVAEDGGALDRSRKSDLYYTAFLLEDCFALEANAPEGARAYLRGFGTGEGLDLVHRACLVRSWAALGELFPTPDFAGDVTAFVETHRSEDGGYAAQPGSPDGTLYHAFLALGVYQDLEIPLPQPERLVESVGRLRARDGGFANALDLPMGTTPSTAAAATVLRNLGAETPAGVDEWLLARAQTNGGFLALPEAPIPDLLSTATALHALSSLGADIDPLREPCLDFVDSLWTGRGFVGHWDDDVTDVEYLFYALLALGHLSV